MTEAQHIARVAMRVPEAAAAAGVSRAFLYGAISDGTLRSSRIGRRRLIRVADLDAWVLRAQEVRK